MEPEKTLYERVNAIMHDSLHRDDESTDAGVRADGIMRNFCFHPGRLESHRGEVIDILRKMPEAFFSHGGGGWSFLNLCMTKDGEHWAEHPTMEALCVLAFALKLGRWVMPKDFWVAMPGGMPYVVFNVPAQP